MELAILIFLSFFLDEPHLDTLSPGGKHRGKPLRQGHGVRSQSWGLWQVQLLRKLQGRGVGHWGPANGGERDNVDVDVVVGLMIDRDHELCLDLT